MNRTNFSNNPDPIKGSDDDPDIHITQDDVVRFLKRGFLVATLIAVIVAAGTFLYERELAPTYESATTLYAADNVVDLRSVGLSYLVSPTLHVDAYKVAAHSQEVLAAALVALGVENPTRDQVDDLRREISVTTNPDSRLIEVTARAGDPTAAVDRSDAVARALVSWDAQRPRDNLMRMIDGLRERVSSLDVQLQGLAAGPQRDSVVALRAEQVAQLSTAVMLSDSVVGRLEVVQPAASPESPVSPSPVFDSVLAGIVAFALTYLVLLLFSVFDGRLRDPNQVQLVTGSPLLAAFPNMPRIGARRPPTVQSGFLRSVLVPHAGSPTSVLFAGVDRSSRTTRLAMVVAESFARAGARTLVVATARDQDVADRLGARPRDENTLEAHLRNPGIPVSPFEVRLEGPGRLAVLTSVEPRIDSSELLSFGFRDGLETWMNEFDVVVVATPPIQEAADAVTVAPMVDRTVLVAGAGAKRSDLATASALARQRGVTPSGVVVTGVRSRNAPQGRNEDAAGSARRERGSTVTSRRPTIAK